MSIKTIIRCDKCGGGWEFDGTETKKWATIRMRSRGWTMGKRHICPDCQRQKLKETK